MNLSITQRIADLCLNELPARVGETELINARMCMIDSLAVAYTATDLPPISMLLDVIGPNGIPNGGASVLGRKMQLLPHVAAEVNGMMISLMLFDDNHAEMRGHPSGPLAPAVLALAEDCGINLDEMLTAFVVGYELECRLGMVLNPSQYEIGWHATATQGAFGATAASALILGLDIDATCRAFGIVSSMLGGLRRNFGTMTMSYHSGLTAAAGVKAARLAAAGFTASSDIFDGEMSVGHVLSREWRPEHLLDGLAVWGVPFCIVNSGPIFKLYPTGRPTLAPIECALALRASGQLAADNIERIICNVSFMYPRTLIHARPTTGLQGKTSLQYCVATSLLDGPPTLGSFTDEAVQRASITNLIEKIEVNVPANLGPEMPRVRAQPFDQPVSVCDYA
jgi:2-methylcitrate dehydratase PrpD